MKKGQASLEYLLMVLVGIVLATLVAFFVKTRILSWGQEKWKKFF